MNDKAVNNLMDQDWSEAWNDLPDAPEWQPRAKNAQVTLRLPAAVVSRIKEVAVRRALPYHALARSWIANGIREPDLPGAVSSSTERLTEQLNIKLDQTLLDDLKARADQYRYPYHRLAREWIEGALAHEEAELGIAREASRRPAMADLMVLLLHSSNSHGEDVVRGITRLQKLLFVLEQKLSPATDFYAYNYGPFDEQVNKTTDALRLAGLLEGGHAVNGQPLSFAAMISVVAGKAGPGVLDDQTSRQEYALTSAGHERAERLRKSSAAYARLASYIAAIRADYDRDDLIERVYSEYPQYTEKSLIRDKVARRAKRRGEH